MHFLRADQFSVEDIHTLLGRAAHYTKNPNGSDFENKLILNLFFENSTRTIASFETAIKRQKGAIVSLTLSQSSIQKGESLKDTILTLNAQQPDAIIVRHPEASMPAKFVEWCDCPIINAGDGTHQHPTQAMLDLFTLWQKWGSVQNRKIVICGDVKHSRVARSNAQLLSIMGANVLLCGPDGFVPTDWNVAFTTQFDAALLDTDAVMMLRIQNERIGQKNTLDMQAYTQQYQLNTARMAPLKPDVVVMHPGPMNRGIEIIDAVADGPNSVILQQVRNSIPVRQAILDLVLNKT